MRFVLAVLLLIGSVFKILYTTYGLSALPFYLIKGTLSLEEESAQLTSSIAVVRERQRQIQLKNQPGEPLSQDDQKEIKRLKNEERILNQQHIHLEFSINEYELGSALNQVQSIWIRMIKCLTGAITNFIIFIFRPFRVAFGVVGLAISVYLFTSLSIVTADRLVNSQCSYSCGFLLTKPQFLNISDMVFVLFQ